jgi:hypothetical protein
MSILGSCADASKLTSENLKKARRAAAWKSRRIIMNNDGNDSRKAKEKTREAFLESRTTPLVGTQVDTIFYCDGIWGSFTHRSPTSDLRKGSDKAYKEWAVDLIKDGGPDPLASIIDFGHKNGIEVFWSFRMNDTHDSAFRMNDTHDSADPTMLREWKKAHPELLVGELEKRRTYKSGGRRWSAADYAQKAVRDRTVGWFDEVAGKYDVDGFELDFFRHLIFFKNPLNGKAATQENLDQMTEVIRRIREIADRHALRRGRPILVSIRVPDSIEYCREVGLDVERWLKEGLVDMMTVSGYFRLSPWKKSVELGHRYDVPVYAGLSESRFKHHRPTKNSIEEYRGRAMSAWKEGVDGIYTFNLFNPKSPVFREVGDPAALAKIEKYYSTGSRNTSHARAWTATGLKHVNRPFPLPDSSRILSQEKPETIEVDVWDDLQQPDCPFRAELSLVVTNVQPSSLKLTVNGKELPPGTQNDKGQWVYPLSNDMLKVGTNRFTLQLKDKPAKVVKLRDLIVWLKMK